MLDLLLLTLVQRADLQVFCLVFWSLGMAQSKSVGSYVCFIKGQTRKSDGKLCVTTWCFALWVLLRSLNMGYNNCDA